MSSIHIEALLASGYALFLVAVADLPRKAGATHPPKIASVPNSWVYLSSAPAMCGSVPPVSTSSSGRSTLNGGSHEYRAEAKSCNSCALKENCTDSEDGRRLEHHLDSWLQSEVRRFHHGISLALLFLAGLILSLETTLQTATTDLAVLLSAMVPVAIMATRLGFGNGGVIRG